MSSEDFSSDEESFEPQFVQSSYGGRSRKTQKKFVEKVEVQEQQFAKFEEYTKGIGSKLLMKMGYKPGQGLGVDGSGIVEPIDVKLRPQKMGLGHGGFDERTKSVKKEKEADEMEEDEDEEDFIPFAKKKIPRSSKKPAVVYKTAEEVIKEQETVKIIDMTGKEAKEMDSFTKEIRRSKLPELRFNLKVLGDSYKSKLENEAKFLVIEKQKLKRLEQDVEKMVDKLDNESKKLDVHNMLFKTLTSIESGFGLLSCKSSISWDDIESQYSGDFSDLEHLYFDQVKSMQLDTLVVGSLAPFIKPVLDSWDIFHVPSLGSAVLKKWIRLLDTTDSLMKTFTYYRKKEVKLMTCFESLLYNLWLPRVRYAIQNHWDPRTPEPLILLLESWNELIPRWMHHNIYDQLIVPRLKLEIQNWNHKKESSQLYTWLFPWLPIASDKFEVLGVWEHARLKLGSCLLDWKPEEDWGLNVLAPWKDVFSDTEIAQLVNRNILPKLTNMIKNSLLINPASQDLKPLEIALEWYRFDFITPSVICDMFAEELFPKWHNVLWKWLGTPGAALEDICEWYLAWKTLFPPTLVDLLTSQFRFALDLMNLALNSPDALANSIPPKPSSTTTFDYKSSQETKPLTKLTFFEYIDLCCSRAGIEFIPLVGKVHSETGKPLYKMSGVSGNSLLLYTEHEVLYCLLDSGDWKPLAVSEALGMVS